MAYYGKKHLSGKAVLAIVIAVLIVAAALVTAWAIGSEGFTQNNPLHFFNDWGTATVQPDEPNDDTEKDNISLASYALDKADFAAYGISPQALEAKVITVDFEPANTTNKRIGWVCKWKDATSTWASGKNINDYVDFVPAADFGASATLAVKQPFGEPVIVTATSRANSALTSSSQFDYVARYDNLWGEGDLVLDYEQEIDVFKDLYASDWYTVIPTEYVANVTFEVETELLSYLNSHGCDCNASENYNNITGAITWYDFFSPLNGFDFDYVSKFLLEQDQEIGYITVEMTCKYTDGFGNEVVYTFTDSECVSLSDACIDEISTPPTDITVNPGGGAF